jgi:P4 family phage/plasmid primase-like protien
VLAPPSNHLLGQYQFAIGYGPGDIEIAICPSPLADLALRAPDQGGESDSTTGETGFDLLRVLAGVPEGERNDQLFRAACSFRATNTTNKVTLQACRDAAGKCSPPFSTTVVQEIVNRVWKTYAAGGKKRRGSGVDPTAAALAGIILEAGNRFAQDVGKQLYVFENGVYRPTGDEFVAVKVKHILCQRGDQDKWSRKWGPEVAEFIRLDAPLLWEMPPLDTLNLANGLLDVKTRKLRSHDPDYLSPVQLPVNFDKNADCADWYKQIADTMPGDCWEMIWQIVAWLMLPIRHIQKAILLKGGGTGKSTLLSALIAFLGMENVCALQLQRLERDRFASARLVGKLANIFADLTSEHLETSSMFKTLTGTDFKVPAERKFKESFDFLNYARQIYSANQYPISEDATDPFSDRWYVIPMEQQLRGTSGEIPRSVLDARLANPTQLSGVLNRARRAARSRGARDYCNSVDAGGVRTISETDRPGLGMVRKEPRRRSEFLCAPGRGDKCVQP